MSLGEIASLFSLGLVTLGGLIEITPIKWNPISLVLEWLGKKMNTNIADKIDRLEKRVNEMDKRMDDDKAEIIRSELLSFSNSCMRHEPHTEKEYENIFMKEQQYYALCKKNEIENGYVEDNMTFVHETYRHCKREGKFLAPIQNKKED